MQFKIPGWWIVRPLDGGCAILSDKETTNVEPGRPIEGTRLGYWSEMLNAPAYESRPVAPADLTAIRPRFVEFYGQFFQSRYLKLAGALAASRGYGVVHVSPADGVTNMNHRCTQIRVVFPDGDMVTALPMADWFRTQDACPLF